MTMATAAVTAAAQRRRRRQSWRWQQRQQYQQNYIHICMFERLTIWILCVRGNLIRIAYISSCFTISLNMTYMCKCTNIFVLFSFSRHVFVSSLLISYFGLQVGHNLAVAAAYEQLWRTHINIIRCIFCTKIRSLLVLFFSFIHFIDGINHIPVCEVLKSIVYRINSCPCRIVSQW